MENWLAFAGGAFGGVVFAALWYVITRWYMNKKGRVS
jgi:hypothetical protein